MTPKARIMPGEPRDKLAKLVTRPGVLIGHPGRLPRIRTFDEPKWRKKWNRRAK